MPFCLSSTRDCFAFDLFVESEVLDMGNGRDKVLKKVFYFNPDNLPENYGTEYIKTINNVSKDKLEPNDPRKYPVGCVTYENFFTHSEMTEMETLIGDTEDLCLNSKITSQF